VNNCCLAIAGQFEFSFDAFLAIIILGITC